MVNGKVLDFFFWRFSNIGGGCVSWKILYYYWLIFRRVIIRWVNGLGFGVELEYWLIIGINGVSVWRV